MRLATPLRRSLSALPLLAVAVALLAQGWDQVGVGVEKTNVQVSQMHMVNGYIASHGQTFGFGLANQFNAFGRTDAANVHARAGCAYQLKISLQGNGFGHHRNAAQTHA